MTRSYKVYLLVSSLLFSWYFQYTGGNPTPWYLQHDIRQIGSPIGTPVDNSSKAMMKAGLGWANGNSVDIEQYIATGKVSWYYSWSPFPTNTTLEFAPMLWGSRSIDDFTRTINQTIKENRVQAILGMNEPEQPGQSNLTVTEGVAMWQTYLQPLKVAFPDTPIRLGSPAPSSAPSGKTWLQDFFTACNGNCSVDFIALHWYGTNATQFQAYIQDFHVTFPNHTFWITEWACQNFVDFSSQCTQDQVVEFMNTTQQFLDEQDYVERYSWFGAMENMQGVNPANALMDSNGRINQLGMQYIGGNGTQIVVSNEAFLTVIPTQLKLGAVAVAILCFLL